MCVCVCIWSWKTDIIQAQYKQDAVQMRIRYIHIQANTCTFWVSDLSVCNTHMYVSNTDMSVWCLYVYVSFCSYIQDKSVTMLSVCAPKYIHIQTCRIPDVITVFYGHVPAEYVCYVRASRMQGATGSLNRLHTWTPGCTREASMTGTRRTARGASAGCAESTSHYAVTTSAGGDHSDNKSHPASVWARKWEINFYIIQQ
jgi:hypothetical protein